MDIPPWIPPILCDVGKLVPIPTGGERVVKDNLRALPARDCAKKWGYQGKPGVSLARLLQDTWVHYAEDQNNAFLIEHVAAIESGGRSSICLRQRSWVFE